MQIFLVDHKETVFGQRNHAAALSSVIVSE